MTAHEWTAALNAAGDAWLHGMVRALWQGSAAILAVWLLGRTLPRLSPGARCWLWRFAYAKMLFALLWATPLALPLLPAPAPLPERPAHITSATVPAPEAEPTPSAARKYPAVRPGGFRFAPTMQRNLTDVASVPRNSAPIQLTAATWLMLFWLLGATACAWRLVGHWRNLRRLRRGTRRIDDSQLTERHRELARRLGLRRTPDLLVTDAVSSPLLLGLGRPAVLLPPAVVDGYAAAEQDAILAHELAHLRRGDLLWGWLAAVVHLLFFFQPLVWLANREWRLAHEVACDELALRVTETPAGEYARALVKMAAGLASPRSPVPLAGAAWAVEESPRTLIRRLTMLRRLTLRSRHLSARPTVAHRTGITLLTLLGVTAIVPWRVTAQTPTRPAAPPAARPESVPAPAAKPATTPAAPKPAPESPAVPGQPPVSPPTAPATAVNSDPSLDEQWEDVLLLEAVRYLRLSPAQMERVLTLAQAAETHLNRLAENEKQTRAALERIAKQNREALLAGRAGVRQEDALFFERTRRQQREEAERQIVAHVLPRLARILTREQLVRAVLLTIGEPVREAGQVAGAALLDPNSGFVSPPEVPAPPRQQAAMRARERVGQARQQWEERRDAAARMALAQRYPQDIVDRVLQPRVFKLALSSDQNPVVSPYYIIDSAVLNLRTADIITTMGETDPRAQAALQELEAYRKRTEVALPRLLAEGRPEELTPALEHLVRRMFASPRLRPVLEQRLGTR